MSEERDKTNEFGRLLLAFQEAQERGDAKAAESIATECLSFAVEEAQANPSESLLLVLEATEYENAAHWEEAEAVRRRALALAESEGNHARAWKTHSDLSYLYTIRGLSDRALHEASAAVAAARKGAMTSLLSTALGDLTRCHLVNGDIASAAAAADEAVQSAPAKKIFEMQRARALLVRARCRMAERRVSDAQNDLDAAWTLLMPLAEASTLAGVQASLATWWEITAGIRTESKDLASAAEAMARSVEFRRTVSQAPQLEGPHKYFWLANALQRYSAALSDAGRFEEATLALHESRAIHEKIGTSLP